MGSSVGLRRHLVPVTCVILAACSDGGSADPTTIIPPNPSADPGGANDAPGAMPAAPTDTGGTDTPGAPPDGGGSAGDGADPPQGPPNATGDDGDTDGDDAGDDGNPPATDDTPAGPTFPPVSDLSATGPFTATTILASGPSSGYTIFHPEELGQDGLKHPILTWGNGATTVPGLFALLPHLASHGFVIIASDNPFVTGALLRGGIDWLFEENERDGSIFFGKLDTSNVASFGYSLGSLGTFEIADDPRLTTTVHISGGAMDKAVVPNLKNPAAFFCGNSSDIAYTNCESDFDLATVPVFYGVFPGDHLGILASHTVQINEAVLGWLRWQLMHDDTLESMFTGPDCTLCTDSRWTVKQKDL